MLIKLDDKNVLEIQGNQARVIIDNNPGTWYQFDVSRVRKVSVEMINHQQVSIYYGNKMVSALISGGTITYDK